MKRNPATHRIVTTDPTSLCCDSRKSHRPTKNKRKAIWINNGKKSTMARKCHVVKPEKRIWRCCARSHGVADGAAPRGYSTIHCFARTAPRAARRLHARLLNQRAFRRTAACEGADDICGILGGE